MIKRPSRTPIYKIRFEGHLHPSRAQMFEGLEMAQEPGGDTILTGPLIDQAALHGVLGRIRDLGLPLVSVQRVAPDEGCTKLKQGGGQHVAASSKQ